MKLCSLNSLLFITFYAVKRVYLVPIALHSGLNTAKSRNPFILNVKLSALLDFHQCMRLGEDNPPFEAIFWGFHFEVIKNVYCIL